MDIQLQNALTEWRHFEGYLTTEEKLASLHDVQGQLIDFLLLKGELPTTAPTTPTADMMAELLGVEERIRRSIQPSSPLDQVDTPSSPVELRCECAVPSYQVKVEVQGRPLAVECFKCHASWSFVKTPAQGVDRISSTSARGASSRFVESLAEESAKLPSKDLCLRCGKYMRFGSMAYCPECLRIDGVIP